MFKPNRCSLEGELLGRLRKMEIYGADLDRKFVFCLLISGLFVIVQGSCYSKKFERYEDQLSVKTTVGLINSFNDTSTKECLALCGYTERCLSVNVNNMTMQCELSTTYPPSVPPSPSQEADWIILYRAASVNAIAAWQLSTQTYQGVTMHAELAIDGNTENDDVTQCAHTSHHYAYWAMELDDLYPISTVIVYFWTDSNYAFRNTNMVFKVSTTRAECDADNGTVCGTYVGPPSNINLPINLTCTTPTVGKFLRINHDYAHHLCLCEVFVM